MCFSELIKPIRMPLGMSEDLLGGPVPNASGRPRIWAQELRRQNGDSRITPERRPSEAMYPLCAGPETECRQRRHGFSELWRRPQDR